MTSESDDADDADDDELTHGLVVQRLPDGEQWHAHLVRSDLLYPCEHLGRPSTILFLLQKLAPGARPVFRPFFLTLDAEGIAEPQRVRYTPDWGERSGTDDQQVRAPAVRRTVPPALQDDRDLQRAVWYVVVDHADHEAIADAHQITRTHVPPFPPE